MTYRELLELTRKYPNPFSTSGRKNRLYDYELQDQNSTKKEKDDESYDSYEDNY